MDLAPHAWGIESWSTSIWAPHRPVPSLAQPKPKLFALIQNIKSQLEHWQTKDQAKVTKAMTDITATVQN